MSETMSLERRIWRYVMEPRDYEISGCPCGNESPEWSEYVGHLWCGSCQKDFIPAHSGIFDGPIPVNCMELMGISLDRIDLATGKRTTVEEYC